PDIFFDWRADDEQVDEEIVDDEWEDEPADEWEDEWEDENEDSEGEVYSFGLGARGRQKPDRGRMVALLSILGDARLLERFVRGVLTKQFDGSEAPALAEAAHLLGPRRAAGLLETVVRERMRAAPAGCVKLLGHVIMPPRESDAERKEWFAMAR